MEDSGDRDEATSVEEVATYRAEVITAEDIVEEPEAVAAVSVPTEDWSTFLSNRLATGLHERLEIHY